MREEEYADILGPIEHTIASHYLVNRTMRDREVTTTLNNLKENYDKPLDFFSNSLEVRVIKRLKIVLRHCSLTHHEFKLVINYLLWSINNRSWMQDQQAYVKWITYALGIFPEKEEANYIKKVEKFARRLGMNRKQIDAILLRDTDMELPPEEIDKSKEESEFYLLNQQQKENFLLEKGTFFYSLLQDHLFELFEGKHFDALNDFYTKFIGKYADFIPIYIIMADIHIDSDTLKSKGYLEVGLRKLQEISDLPPTLKERLEKEMKGYLKILKDSSLP